MGAFPGCVLTSLVIVSHNPQQTQSLGSLLGRLAQPGDVALLVGPLGAGKTCLVQGIARGLEVREHVTSPTFIMVHEYRGRMPLYHVDAFRLTSAEETVELGLDDYFGGRGLTVVEWADKVPEAVPPQHLLITIEYSGKRDRILHMEARGPRYEQLLEMVSERQTPHEERA